MKTRQEERADKLVDIDDQFSEQAIEDMKDQGRKVAAGLLQAYGDKACLSATGFINCVVQATELALAWAILEGIVTLNESAQAPEDEVSKRREERAQKEEQLKNRRKSIEDYAVFPSNGQYL